MTVESPELPTPPENPPPAPAPRRRGVIGKALAAVALAFVLAAAIAALRWVLQPVEPPLWGALPAGADVYIHADLAALRNNPAVAWYLKDAGDSLPGTGRSGDTNGDAENDDAGNETRKFVEATGFEYQRDLHQLAAARKNDHWIGAARLTIDRRRFEDYLRGRSSSTTQLASAPVYTFGGMRPLKIALVSDRELVFSIGPAEDGEDGLAEAMLLLAQRRNAATAAGHLEQSLAASAVPKWRAVLGRPLWVVGDGQSIFEPENNANRPSLSGFIFGAETLQGVETLLVSVEAGALTLGLDGELICRSDVAPKPLADNLTLLASLLRPRDPESGSRDLRPLWDALKISTRDSSVLVNWRPTPQMMSLLTAEGK